MLSASTPGPIPSPRGLNISAGLLYSTGVIFYVNKRLRYARAIWHGHVVAAAGAHWCAVLIGVVLAGS